MRDVPPVLREDYASIASALGDVSWLQGKRVLLSGVTGFLGGYLAGLLLTLSDRMDLKLRLEGIARDRRKARTRIPWVLQHPAFTFIETDLNEPFRNACQYDCILHAASKASPVHYRTDPVGTMLTNMVGTQSLLELSAQSGTGCRFLFLSSSEVYGQVESPEGVIREEDHGKIELSNIRSCYAESKRCGEVLTNSYAHQHGFWASSVRLFHTYGPGVTLEDGRVFSDFLRCIVQKQNMVLSSDGTAVRAFCYAADAAHGILRVLCKGESGQAYNIGNPDQAYSIRDLAEILCRRFSDRELSVEVNKTVDRSYVPSPFQVQVPAVGRLKALGWRPSVSVEEGFERTVSFTEHMIKNGENS